MLRKVTRIQGLPLAARDGKIGAVEDLYFDEVRWAVRYLVVDTGDWLGTGRKVLVSPREIRHGEWPGDAIRVELSRAQIEDSPPVPENEPISRRYEMLLGAYYGHPHYWSGPFLWGQDALPVLPPGVRRGFAGGEAREPLAAIEDAPVQARRSYLRSCGEIIGYRVEAGDGSVGQVDDLLVDDESWGIPYLVVDKRAWLPGGQVLILPDMVDGIDWATRSLHLAISRDAVEGSPDYRS